NGSDGKNGQERIQQTHSLAGDAIKNQEKVLTEETAKDLLAKYGIQVPKSALVTSESEAIHQAKQLGFPLVAKIVSPDILHKTDVGGVQTNLRSIADVRRAFRAIYGKLGKRPNVHGLLLERMEKPGVELIVGFQNDPQFGPT